MNLPETFVSKMKRLLGSDYENYEKCFDLPRHYGLRVNTAKISVDEFLKIAPWPLRPVPWIENGFYYDGDVYQPARHPYYFAGLYYLQEPSAMTPANRLPIDPGDRVLDVCAAPGGKATELGARLNGTGVLAANDLSSSRAKGLLKNLELFGIGNVLVLCEEPGKLVPCFQEYFDKILIDAPCSGEGMFRKDKKMIRAWEEHGPEYFSRIQKSIITQAARMLAPVECCYIPPVLLTRRRMKKQLNTFFRNIRNSRSAISGRMRDFLPASRKKPTGKIRIFPEQSGSFLTGWKERAITLLC